VAEDARGRDPRPVLGEAREAAVHRAVADRPDAPDSAIGVDAQEIDRLVFGLQLDASLSARRLRFSLVTPSRRSVEEVVEQLERETARAANWLGARSRCPDEKALRPGTNLFHLAGRDSVLVAPKQPAGDSQETDLAVRGPPDFIDDADCALRRVDQKAVASAQLVLGVERNRREGQLGGPPIPVELDALDLQRCPPPLVRNRKRGSGKRIGSPSVQRVSHQRADRRASPRAP
jgi:hypothetical protein